MISRLFKKKTATAPAALVPSVPGGTIVWAIGDVHGQLDLMKALVDAIIRDAQESRAERKVVIFLGDYVDRGPDSRGVIRFLVNLAQIAGIEWRFLKGNHEDAMLRFLSEPGFGPTWCDYGGDAALASYGLKPPTLKHRQEAWVPVAADLDHRLQPAERAFLEELELSFSVGDYFFAHAGARPGRPLEDQVPDDLLWIRRSFLDNQDVFSKVVVHGHTPSRSVFSDHRRIGIDTKAYESGVLSALRLEGSRRDVIQSVAHDGEDQRVDRFELTPSVALAG